MGASCRLYSGTIGIIGTAGRGSDAEYMSRELYDDMYRRLIDTLDEWQVDDAVSGGAAWADHLAVRAFLEGYLKDLTLFLPAEFRDGKFVPDARQQFNPGQTLNYYHDRFSKVCGIDSRRQLAMAIEAGARARVIPGFHARNAEVARHANFLVAFTFGKASTPEVSDFCAGEEGYATSRAAGLKDGGTAHTWGMTRNASIKRSFNLYRIVLKASHQQTGEPAQGTLML